MVSVMEHEGKNDAEEQLLDDQHFIRHRLYGGGQGLVDRYRSLVTGRPGWWGLIKYELVTSLFGPVPGALGLALRKLTYPGLFAAVGRGAVFGRNLTLRYPEAISIGDSVVLDDYALVDARGAGTDGIQLADRVIVNRGAKIQAKFGGITIGADTSIGGNVSIVSQGPIDIAENVSIAGGATIAGGRYVVEEDETDPAKKARYTAGAIWIGANTRVGMNAVVLDGVTVGENAIIAPGAVVFDDVPASTVVLGNPARPWRARRGGADAAKGTGGGASGDDIEGRADPGAVKLAVLGFLENEFFIDIDETGLSDSDSLLDRQLIDSLALVRLMAWMEQCYGVTGVLDSTSPADIDTVENIVTFILRHRSG